MSPQFPLTGRDVGRHVELLDDHRVDDSIRLAAVQDVCRANTYFGGTRVVLREFHAALETGMGPGDGETITLLDVGTGAGDLPARLRDCGLHRGYTVRPLGVDLSPALARAAGKAGTIAVCGNGLSLPFAERSFDIVLCSQLLHHFVDGEAICLLRELNRVARRRVIVCDLRRSWVAAGGFWLAALPLRFHPVTRHDGVRSVRRGFTRAELTRLVRFAVGQRAVARGSLGFRLSVSWVPRRLPEWPSLGWLGF